MPCGPTNVKARGTARPGFGNGTGLQPCHIGIGFWEEAHAFSCCRTAVRLTCASAPEASFLTLPIYFSDQSRCRRVEGWRPWDTNLGTFGGEDIQEFVAYRLGVPLALERGTTGGRPVPFLFRVPARRAYFLRELRLADSRFVLFFSGGQLRLRRTAFLFRTGTGCVGVIQNPGLWEVAHLSLLPCYLM